MQFYLDGYRAGDPAVQPAAADAVTASRPDTVDVLIVGCGPAGLVLAAQLAQFADITTRIVERRTGPLELGQADGVACRTVEMFHAFGLSDRMLREAYWVNETVFWSPSDSDRSQITRRGRVQDTEDGLSEFPHVIVNQARIHQYLLDAMDAAPRRLTPDYGMAFVGYTNDHATDHPIVATFRPIDGGDEVTVHAKYLVGCDGARSAVRASMGRALEGDSASQAWGVMDVLADTTFPDIRFKAVIQSTAGNIVLIPREGGYLIRLYVELGDLDENERVSARNTTVDELIEVTRRILHPHRFDVRDVVWWSVYEIGQRLCDGFDDVLRPDTATEIPRVFIAGDACHTHSPKAGQGMNVSMQDGFNLGWKLAAVLQGRSKPELLRTYTRERHAVAKELIDFDREWASIISAPPRDHSDPDGEGADPDEVSAYFIRSGRYTAGVSTRYAPEMLTRAADDQEIAAGLPVGMRFHSAPVRRLKDAKPMHLGHAASADGRWRLYAFGDDLPLDAPASRLRAFCDYLENDPGSPVRRYTPAGGSLDAVFDLRAVLQQSVNAAADTPLPEVLAPRKGRFALVDHEKVFCSEPFAGAEIYEARGISRTEGALVVVRPDQYVAAVLALDDRAGLEQFFDAFMCEPQRSREAPHLVESRAVGS